MRNKTFLIIGLLIAVFAIHPAKAVTLLDTGFSKCGTGQLVFEEETKEGEQEGEQSPEEEECE